MFSKEWIESCSCSIDSYESPADVDKKDKKIFKAEHEKDISLLSGELSTRDHVLDIKRMLKKMKERRGE
jgi:hypothetical protein